jgi:hypothetical protein
LQRRLRELGILQETLVGETRNENRTGFLKKAAANLRRRRI